MEENIKTTSQLPEINFYGTTYVADINYALLFKKSAPEQSVHFGSLLYTGAAYVTEFDKKEKILVSTPDECVPWYAEVAIPEMCVIDRPAMLQKYGLSLDDPSLKHDEDFKCDPILLKQRLDGRLPQIEIAGEKYEVHLEERFLCRIENPTQCIELNELGQNPTGTTFTAFYDLGEKRLVPLLELPAKLSASIVGLEIPGPYALDPYIYCQKKGLPYTQHVVDRMPLRTNLKAKVVPLSPEWTRQAVNALRKAHQLAPLLTAAPEKLSLSMEEKEKIVSRVERQILKTRAKKQYRSSRRRRGV